MKSEKSILTLLPDGKKAAFGKNTLLLDALFDMGVIVKTPCGGKGLCGKCGIKVRGDLSPKSASESRLFPDDESMRLACVSTLQGDVAAFPETTETTGHVVMPDITLGPEYGAAVDMGTTTIQFSLVDFSGGGIYRFPSFLNPQRRWGHDVISRIAAATHQDAADTLTRLLRTAIESSIIDTQNTLSLPRSGLTVMSFSGNTTMSYFLMGIDASPIGVYPYLAARRDFDTVDIPFHSLGLTMHQRVLPIASSFLGGDLVGGLAISDTKGYTTNTIFIDLGTNGELFLRNGSGDIHATSCAMGPALEGMNISYGMTADEGAVGHLKAGPEGMEVSVVGGGPPLGICGTGIIDAIALLLREGVVAPSGTYTPLAPGKNRLFPDGVITGSGTKQVRLAGDVSLTQKDIRNVQLAKGASLAAARILLRYAGVHPEDITHVLIAGAFGENLDIENFKRLKFLPEFPNAEYVFLGNTSLAAAEQACLSAEFMDRARSLRDRISIVELSADPEFNNEFMRCLDF